MQIIIWSNKTMVNLWLPWLQEHGNSKRILRQMLMVKLLPTLLTSTAKEVSQDYERTWKWCTGFILGFFLFRFSFLGLGPGLLMSFPVRHSFRSFMIICIRQQIWREGVRERRCGKGASHVLSYCVHFLSLYIGYLFMFIFLFMYMYILI